MTTSRSLLRAAPGLTAVALLLGVGSALAGCAVLPGGPSVAQPTAAVAQPVGHGTDRSGGGSADVPTPGPSDDGSGADDTFGAGCKPDVVAQICVDVALTGERNVSGDRVASSPEPPGAAPDTTCAAIAADDDGGGNLGDQLAGLDGHTVAWDATLTDYHGPGTYHPREVHLTIDDQAFSTSGRGRATVAVSPSFATVITLTDLVSADHPGATVSGRIVWTCIDPSTS
jgi:hypothetical protein